MERAITRLASGARTTDIGGLVADYPGDQFHYVVSRLVSASRAYGVIPMDSAYGDFADLEGFEAAAKRAVSNRHGRQVVQSIRVRLRLRNMVFLADR